MPILRQFQHSVWPLQTIDLYTIQNLFVDRVCQVELLARKYTGIIKRRSMQMFVNLSISAHGQFANKNTSQHREKVAHVHGHNSQHAVRSQVQLETS